MVSLHCILPGRMLICPAETGGLVLLSPVGRTQSECFLLCSTWWASFTAYTREAVEGCLLPKLMPRAQDMVVQASTLTASHPATLASGAPLGRSKLREWRNQSLFTTQGTMHPGDASSALMNGWTWFSRVFQGTNPALECASVSGTKCGHCPSHGDHPLDQPSF